MKIDTRRYFDISEIGDGETTSPPSKETLLELAQQVTNLCQEHSPRQGSLYMGGLGPHVYVPLQWARRLEINKKNSNNKNNNDEAIQHRRQLLQTAKQAAEFALDDSHSSQFRVSLLEGKWVGAKSGLAIVEHALGNPTVAKQHAHDVIERLARECAALPDGDAEVLYGRAGAMQAILFLRSELNDISLGSDFVVAMAKHILRYGLQEAQRQLNSPHLPLVWKWHDKVYLGAAHGIVGILHTLLHLTPEEWTMVEHDIPNPRDRIHQTIDALSSHHCCYESGNLMSSMGSGSHHTDRLVHWCHGAPGHVLLLMRASKVFGNPQYLQQAERIAERVLWPRGIVKKGLGLCHGISGNALVLLRLSQEVVGENGAVWRQRAMRYAQFAVDHWDELEAIPDRPYSLYEGLSGLVCFLLALTDDDSSAPVRFPLYEHC
jgi:lantibiotic modifying enzyme